MAESTQPSSGGTISVAELMQRPNVLAAYIFRNGDARQLFEFYAEVFGGTLEIMDYGSGPLAGEDPNLVMHAELHTADGWVILGADSPEQGSQAPGAVTLCIMGPHRERGEELFNKLCAGGEVLVPFEKQFWGSYYGMARDKFGIQWSCNVGLPDEVLTQGGITA